MVRRGRGRAKRGRRPQGMITRRENWADYEQGFCRRWADVRQILYRFWVDLVHLLASSWTEVGHRLGIG